MYRQQQFVILQAIGEPPLFLASSVFFATKEAILSARADAGYHGNFRLDSPATPERVRMACKDEFTQLVRVFVCRDWRILEQTVVSCDFWVYSYITIVYYVKLYTLTS